MVQVHVPRGVGVQIPPWAPNVSFITFHFVRILKVNRINSMIYAVFCFFTVFYSLFLSTTFEHVLSIPFSISSKRWIKPKKKVSPLTIGSRTKNPKTKPILFTMVMLFLWKPHQMVQNPEVRNLDRINNTSCSPMVPVQSCHIAECKKMAEKNKKLIKKLEAKQKKALQRKFLSPEYLMSLYQQSWQND